MKETLTLVAALRMEALLELLAESDCREPDPLEFFTEKGNAKKIIGITNRYVL
ncbi:MAG: hypothetical protein WA775_03700 [Psychroserpens sp.]|uniref:hypothetical protein n=1 Tax=Psychroserpens sp. TaxID=2020870 RepID=UPI003CB39A58